LHADDAHLRQLLGEALVALGDLESACASFSVALEEDAANVELHLRFIEVLVACGRLDAAREASRRLPADWRPTENSGVRYRRALAALMTGGASQAAELIAPEKYLHVGELACPTGFAGDKEFRRALHDEIMNNPTLDADLRGKATRDGLQTRHFPMETDRAARALLAEIETQVCSYMDRMIASDDPFFLRKPRAATLESWAVVGGPRTRQTSHIHPNGWLSGVYYVDAPDALYDGAGDLLLGMPPSACEGMASWPIRRVAPVPGRLVLFPSWVPHATAPTGSDAPRVSVAFDVVPMPSN
jgi:hypothetical protein